MENIYDRIRKVYEASGLTRQEFANSLGSDGSYICKIVKGTYHGNVSEGLLKLIAAVYNVDIEWLQSGKGEMQVAEEQAPYLDDLNRRIITEMAGLSVETRMGILQYVKEKRLLAELMRSRPDEGIGK